MACRCLMRSRRIRSWSIRVIMVTAKGQASDYEAGMARGADAYFIKPFSPLQLVACIGNARNAADAGPHSSGRVPPAGRCDAWRAVPCGPGAPPRTRPAGAPSVCLG